MTVPRFSTLQHSTHKHPHPSHDSSIVYEGSYSCEEGGGFIIRGGEQRFKAFRRKEVKVLGSHGGPLAEASKSWR